MKSPFFACSACENPRTWAMWENGCGIKGTVSAYRSRVGGVKERCSSNEVSLPSLRGSSGGILSILGTSGLWNEKRTLTVKQQSELPKRSTHASPHYRPSQFSTPHS